MLHGDSNQTYHVVVNGREEATVIIPAKTTGKLREGAAPPTMERMRSHGKEIPQKAAYKPKRAGNWRNEGEAEPKNEESINKGEQEEKAKQREQQMAGPSEPIEEKKEIVQDTGKGKEAGKPYQQEEPKNKECSGKPGKKEHQERRE